MIRTKAAATAELAKTFRETDALLEKQIDRLVFPLRKTHPEFYADYQRARQIWDAPGASGESSAAAGPAATATSPAEPKAA
jgi:hypothetical protein